MVASLWKLKVHLRNQNIPIGFISGNVKIFVCTLHMIPPPPPPPAQKYTTPLVHVHTVLHHIHSTEYIYHTSSVPQTWLGPKTCWNGLVW